MKASWTWVTHQYCVKVKSELSKRIKQSSHTVNGLLHLSHFHLTSVLQMTAISWELFSYWLSALSLRPYKADELRSLIIQIQCCCTLMKKSDYLTSADSLSELIWSKMCSYFIKTVSKVVLMNTVASADILIHF